MAIDDLEELARDARRRAAPSRRSPTSGRRCARELRRFDRVGRPSERELLVVLPGADGPRGEIVARRVLERLRAIKIEADGERRPLRVSVGLAAWREDVERRGAARARARGRASGETAPTARPALTELGARRRCAGRTDLHNLTRCSPDQSCGCCA